MRVTTNEYNRQMADYSNIRVHVLKKHNLKYEVIPYNPKDDFGSAPEVVFHYPEWSEYDPIAWWN